VTHAPLFWESEPPPKLAHAPLPKSSIATLNPRIGSISKLHVWGSDPHVSEAFLTHRTIRGMTECRHAAMFVLQSLNRVKRPLRGVIKKSKPLDRDVRLPVLNLIA
jgi:hypothetical protein